MDELVVSAPAYCGTTGMYLYFSLMPFIFGLSYPFWVWPPWDVACFTVWLRSASGTIL